MEQFATALGQAAFVDGLDERGRKGRGRKGRIPVSRYRYIVRPFTVLGVGAHTVHTSTVTAISHSAVAPAVASVVLTFTVTCTVRDLKHRTSCTSRSH